MGRADIATLPALSHGVRLCLHPSAPRLIFACFHQLCMVSLVGELTVAVSFVLFLYAAALWVFGDGDPTPVGVLAAYLTLLAMYVELTSQGARKP